VYPNQLLTKAKVFEMLEVNPYLQQIADLEQRNEAMRRYL
jgi:hypothetical protein